MKQRDDREYYSPEEENRFDEFESFSPERYSVNEKQEIAAEDLMVDEISDGSISEEKKEENPLLEQQRTEVTKNLSKTAVNVGSSAVPSAVVVTSAVAVVSASVLGIVPIGKVGYGEIRKDALSVMESPSALTVSGEIEEADTRYRYGAYLMEYCDGEALGGKRESDLVFSEDEQHFTFSFPLSYGLDSYSYTVFCVDGNEIHELYTFTDRYEKDQSYQAEYQKVLPTQSRIDFLSNGRYRVMVDTGFHTENPEVFSYAVDIIDQDGNIYGSYSGTDSSFTIDIEPLKKMYFRYSDIGTFYSGIQCYQEYLSSDYSWISLPSLTLYDEYEFADDQFLISYQTESDYEFGNCSVILQFDNGTENFTKTLPFSEERYPVFLDGFTEEIGTLKVNGYLDFQDERLDPYPHRIPIAEKAYQMDYSFEVGEVVADHSESGQDQIPVSLSFIYRIPSTYQIRIESQDFSILDTFQVTESYSFKKIPSGDGGTISLSVYKPDGTKWKDSKDIRIHTKDEVDAFYSSPQGVNFPNPSDAVVTFNEDGTINLYRDMNYAFQDEVYSYDSFLYTDALMDDSGVISEYIGGIHHHFRDRISVMENLAMEEYRFLYYILYRLDGVDYRMEKGTNSGSLAVGSETITATGTYDSLADKTTITINNDNGAFMDNRILIDGEEMSYDSFSGDLEEDYTLTVDGDRTGAELTVYSNLYLANADVISVLVSMKGEKYRAVTIPING